MPTKKRKRYNARFPPSRIKKIMQTDEDVGKVAAAVPVLISRALELFVETFMKDVNRVVEARGAKTITPGHLKRCIHAEPRFDFLKEVASDVPDLQGDTDEKEPSSSSSVGLDAAATSGSQEATSGRPAGRMQRQLSTPRPRARGRKRSSDSKRVRRRGTKKSSRASLDQAFPTESDDEEEEELATDDEEDASASAAVTPAQAGETTPSQLVQQQNGALVTTGAASNGISGSQGAATTAVPVFQLSFDLGAQEGGGGGRGGSSRKKGRGGDGGYSAPLLKAHSSLAAAASSSSSSSLDCHGSFAEVDEDYDT